MGGFGGWWGGGWSGGWWNPWWWGYGLSNPAEPQLEPGYWNIAGAIDKVLAAGVAESARYFASPLSLLQTESLPGVPAMVSSITSPGPVPAATPPPLAPAAYAAAAPAAATAVASTTTTMDLGGATGAVDHAPWNPEDIVKVLNQVAPDAASFWAQHGHLAKIPSGTEREGKTPVSSSVPSPSESRYPDSSLKSLALQGVWLVMPGSWTSRNVAVALLGHLFGAVTNAPSPPVQQVQQAFKQFANARDVAPHSPPQALSKSMQLDQTASDQKAKTALKERMMEAYREGQLFNDYWLYSQYQMAYGKYDELKKEGVYIKYLLDPEGLSEPVAALALSEPEVWQAFVQQYGLPGVARLESVVRWGWKVGKNNGLWYKWYVDPAERTAEFRAVSVFNNPLDAKTSAQYLHDAIYDKQITAPKTKNGETLSAGDFPRWHGEATDAHTSLQQAIAQINGLGRDIRNDILLQVCTGPLPTGAVKAASAAGATKLAAVIHYFVEFGDEVKWANRAKAISKGAPASGEILDEYRALLRYRQMAKYNGAVVARAINGNVAFFGHNAGYLSLRNDVLQLLKTATGKWQRCTSAEQTYFLSHAESLALIRAAMGSDVKGKTVTLVVDQIVCRDCRYKLPRLLDLLDIKELRVYQAGSQTPLPPIYPRSP